MTTRHPLQCRADQSGCPALGRGPRIELNDPVPPFVGALHAGRCPLLLYRFSNRFQQGRITRTLETNPAMVFHILSPLFVVPFIRGRLPCLYCQSSSASSFVCGMMTIRRPIFTSSTRDSRLLSKFERARSAKGGYQGKLRPSSRNGACGIKMS